MINNIRNLILLPLIVFPNYVVAASKMLINCPQQIEAVQRATSHFPKWHTIEEPTVHYLSRITLYAGEPDKLASLAPTFSRDNSKAIWQFSPQDHVHVVCGYNRTTIALSQALPAHISQCTLSFKQEVMGESGFIPDKLICE